MKTRILVVSLIALLGPLGCATEHRPPLFFVGVGTHLGRAGVDPVVDLGLARQAGLNAIRDEVLWSEVERSRGELVIPPTADVAIDEAIHAGLEPMLILDYGNPLYDDGGKPQSPDAVEAYTRYARAVVEHFRGRVTRFEVWNEWDIGLDGSAPGDAPSYAALLCHVYPVLHSVAPGISIYGASMSARGFKEGWFKGFVEAGGIACMDGLSFHGYNYFKRALERSPEEWRNYVDYAEGRLREATGGRDVPIVVSETSWPVHVAPAGASLDVAAAFAARLFLLARTLPFVEGVWWFDLADAGVSPTLRDENFGLLHADRSPKSAWFAVRSVAALVAHAEGVERIDVGQPEVWVLKFRGPRDGEEAWAAWSVSVDRDWELELEAREPDLAPLTMTAAGKRDVEREWRREPAARSSAPEIGPQRVTLTVRGEPWIVRGPMREVAIASVRSRYRPESMRPRLGPEQLYVP